MKVILHEFDAIIEDIKNNRKTTISISVKSHGSSINLLPLIIKLINAEKAVFKKDYGFNESFNIFDEIDKKRNKLNEYKPRAYNKISTKNAMLEYLKIMENRLIDMFSTSSIIKK